MYPRLAKKVYPINIQENIEELTIIEKGIFHHFLYVFDV
jgi:hypothetical protein